MLDREYVRAAAVAARNVLANASIGSLRHLAARGPRALLAYALEAAFLERAMFARRGLRERHVSDALPAPNGVAPEIRLDIVAEETAWFGGVTSYLADLVALCLLAKLTRARIAFEIGTLRGLTAYHLAMNVADDGVVYSLDLPAGSTGGSLAMTVLDRAHVIASAVMRYHFTGKAEERKITLLHGDSATFDFSPWREKVDLFFVDGAHSYEYVRSDTERARTCVRRGGVIAWHDAGRTGVNGVTRYLLELRAQGVDVCIVPGGSLAYAIVA